MTGLWSVLVPTLDAPVLGVTNVLEIKGLCMAVTEDEVGKIRPVTVHRVDVVGDNGRIPSDPLRRGLKGCSWHVPKADGALNVGLGGN